MNIALTLPKRLLSLSFDQRLTVIDELTKALQVDKPKSTANEHNIWSPHKSPAMAELEDDLYNKITGKYLKGMDQLRVSLGLDPDQQKGRQLDFHQHRKKGKAWHQIQLDHLDNILKNSYPNLDQLARLSTVKAALLSRVRHRVDGHELNESVKYQRFPNNWEKFKKKGAAVVLQQSNKRLLLPTFSDYEIENMKHDYLHCTSKMDEIRHRHQSQIKQLLIRASKERWSVSRLEDDLNKLIAKHQYEWRRVVLTEMNRAHNDMYLLGLKTGDMVTVAPVAGACSRCKSLLEGKTFKYMEYPPEQMDSYILKNYVWAGKTNMGRAYNDWIPSIPLHPHCRHYWIKVSKR
jgi:hypothetical protein